MRRILRFFQWFIIWPRRFEAAYHSGVLYVFPEQMSLVAVLTEILRGIQDDVGSQPSWWSNIYPCYGVWIYPSPRWTCHSMSVLRTPNCSGGPLAQIPLHTGINSSQLAAQIMWSLSTSRRFCWVSRPFYLQKVDHLRTDCRKIAFKILFSGCAVVGSVRTKSWVRICKWRFVHWDTKQGHGFSLVNLVCIEGKLEHFQ